MVHELRGVRIDDLDGAELDQKLEDWLAGQGSHVIVTPNAEFLLEARRNRAFKNLLNQSDLAIADSVSLQYAAAALSPVRLEHRIPGVDLLDRLCDLAANHHSRVLLLGGAPGAAEGAARRLETRHAALHVDSIDPGYVTWNNDQLVMDAGLIEALRSSQPTIVAVALGQHKQEQFIDQVRVHCPGVKIWIGVGGALEMIAGHKRRAPRWWSKIGLEWLWRLLIEPRRAGRIFNAAIVFPLAVGREAYRRGTLLSSSKNVFKEIFRTLITTPNPSLKRRGTEEYDR